MSKSDVHVPVLLDEFLELFEGKKIETFYEGTLGLGGHAEAMLKAHPEIECYMGCDQDSRAIELAKERLEPWKDKVAFIHDSFGNLDSHLAERGIEQVDGFFLTWESRRCNSIKGRGALASQRRDHLTCV